uniref:Uncharacterized protein n=1 Tax=Chenopodium quinoa TaxID=63459 RepID=A0A803N4Q9_CHEQI
MEEASRKLDTANTRLAIIEMKLDSKPGYPESVAIGVTSTVAFRDVAAVWPQLVFAASSLWNSSLAKEKTKRDGNWRTVNHTNLSKVMRAKVNLWSRIVSMEILLVKLFPIQILQVLQ